MDDTGGMYGAMCALTGLYHRNMTGQGQHIDQAQMIAGIPLTALALLDFTVNGRRRAATAIPPAIAPTGPARPWSTITGQRRAPQCLSHPSWRLQRLVRDCLQF